MFVKVREGAITPGWVILKEKKFIEVRAVATWTPADPNAPGKYTTERQQFIEKKEDLDNIPEMCEISIMFEDGTYVQLPLPTFIDIFIIIPSGEYSSAIYGD